MTGAEAATTTPNECARLARLIPIPSWIPTYERGWRRSDVIAGLTLWGLVVREVMAHAGIAGLPAQADL